MKNISRPENISTPRREERRAGDHTASQPPHQGLAMMRRGELPAGLALWPAQCAGELGRAKVQEFRPLHWTTRAPGRNWAAQSGGENILIIFCENISGLKIFQCQENI